MNGEKFKAIIVTEVEDKKFIREIGEKSIEELPEGDVLIKVSYSSLNYKDALSVIGNKGVTRKYPHTPGVDASGVVSQSTNSNFNPGDNVLVTGYDLGMNTSGGFGQFIRVPSEWVVNVPDNMSLKECMMYGTAGFTAALSVFKLDEHGITPDKGEILVTGATGGVGSTAVAILSKAGYHVIASTGKMEENQFLIDIGAKGVISREDSIDTSGRLLLKGRWAGVVDTVGGEILSTAIKSTKDRGVVTCCGNVASHELNINVYPFILRGVSLIGIDSENQPIELKYKIWEKISTVWKLDNLEYLTKEISFDELDENIDLILEGKQKGRVVLDLWKKIKIKSLNDNSIQ